MKISELITLKYKLRIPPTVYYDLLADVVEAEEEQEPTTKNDCETCIHNKGVLECDMYGCKYEPTTKNDLGVDCISRAEMLKYQEYLHGKMPNEENHKLWKFIKELPSVTPQEPRWIHAKWKQLDNEPDTFFTMHQYECSNCGKIQLAKSKNIKKFRYCSKCGADMRGEKT